MTAAVDRAGRYDGLSCYLANLARYLDAECDAAALIAPSVRLAVRTDLPDRQLAFSHHRRPLSVLAGGDGLHHAHSTDPARAEAAIRAQVAAYGRVLVTVDTSRLPWSPSSGGAPAPHWLLVDAGRGDGFHVVDEFTGLLPGGPQHRHDGELSVADLLAAMTPPPRWSPEQRTRNDLAFGLPQPAPAHGELWWIERRPDPPSPGGLDGQWLCGDAAALPFLAGFFATHGERAAHHLDDLWSVAQHRVFALRHAAERRAVTEDELAAWTRLPSALKFAVDSARRGRPRISLIRATFDNLLNLRQSDAPEDDERTVP